MTEAQFLTATRAAYDTIAADYADHFHDELAAKPLDRAMLAAFAELVRNAGARPVIDAGCGPGLVTAHLHSLGLSVFGVDLSREMIELAQRAHPEVRFEEGSMAALDVADATLGGLVSWYSTIHTPADRLPELFAEFHRILAPGGHLLVAFQVGDERRHLTQWLDHDIELDLYLRVPDDVVRLLTQAGFIPVGRLLREAGQLERLPRVTVLVRKPSEAELLS
jgi:SAM-dependent methyltransferase